MSRLVGLGLVIALHIVLVFALVTALAWRRVDVAHAPIETRIIEQVQQPKLVPPPPPNFAPPLPPFVPPPEVRIAAPPAPAATTAITAVTNVKPAAPAPPHQAVIVQPQIDAAHSHKPDYPLVSRQLGEQGSVILQAFVGVDGKVSEAKIVQSSGFARLDQAAIDGVKSDYRFLAGTSDGTAQPMCYNLKFTCKLG